MNLTESIYFDGDCLVMDKPSKIIYKGCLTNDQPDEIYMHFGYGLLWENLQEIKLSKGISGYEADITFSDYGDVFFCFRSSNGPWDNNSGQNYATSISKPEVTLISTEHSYLPEVPRLKKGYLIKKKIKVAFYRTISIIAKLLSGDILLKFLHRKKNTN